MPITSTPRKIQFSDFKWIFDYKTIVATGTILLFIYFLKIGYYPSSFDIGDTTVIFLVVFGFGIVVLFTILLYFILAYAIYSCYHARKKGNKIEFWVMFINSLGILILIGFMCFKLQFNVYSYGLLLAFGILLVLTFMIETDSEEDFFICTFILYILVCGIPFSLPVFKISTLMEMVGIAKNNITIQIDEKELIKIKDMSEKLKIPLLRGCHEHNKNDIYNMELLWSGIGSYALLKFPEAMSDNIDRTIVVKNDTLSFSSNTFSSGCIIYDIDELPMHSKNKNDVKEEIKVKVEEKLIHFMKKNEEKQHEEKPQDSDFILDKIVITGFSDKRDTKDGLNNYELSRQRAEYAKEVLCEMEWKNRYLKDKKNEFCTKDSNKIEVKGSGRKYANEKCEYLSHQKYRAKKYQSELDECFAPDRKVEFKFEFLDKSKQDETKKDK